MSEPRVILVSGGSRGLGKSIVGHFLAQGDCVATFSRRGGPTIDAWAADAQVAQRFWHEQLDAADSGSLEAFVRHVHEKFGRIDVLINNAGLAHDGVLPAMAIDKIDQMLAVNLRASIVLAKECARFMLLAESGSIINIASIIGHTGFAGLAAYAATKSGQIGMTRALARELGPRNIRVNAVAPGYLETEMASDLDDTQLQQIVRRTPLGRLGAPDDIVPCIDFLISPGGRFITGQVFTIDGGATA
jgi:3-oxoacyl-[acyl-carrier protein] reductase